VSQEVPADVEVLTLAEKLRAEADALDRLREQIWRRLNEDADRNGDNGHA